MGFLRSPLLGNLGNGGSYFRLRGDYEKQTDAVFTKKIDGVGWESKRDAFRLPIYRASGYGVGRAWTPPELGSERDGG